MRNTPQTTVILEELHTLGHATNRQLWENVAKKIHGITLNESTVEQLQSQLDQAVIEKCLFIAGICRKCVSTTSS